MAQIHVQSPSPTNVIHVGVTEAHGMAKEFSQFPAPGVRYSFLTPQRQSFSIIRSPIKGYLRRFEAENHDLIEAIISPVITADPWIYSLECFPAAIAFGVFGFSVPRVMRIKYIKKLLLKDNLKKLIFWSEAGKKTMLQYGHINDERIIKKSAVIYPAIRKVPDSLLQFNDREVRLLFSGDFFRKGGVNVIDAFERAQKLYPCIRLRLCCDERLDFNTPNTDLRSEYLSKIRNNKGITSGRVSRDQLVHNILPETDIYLLPTYVETFGFALLEAMAFGIPVISSRHFAIPEIVEHEVTGLLIDTSQYDCEHLFQGYVVKRIPTEFRDFVTEKLFKYMCQLIEFPELRKKIGLAAVNVARTKFSFETRNQKMLAVYREALQRE